MLRDSDFITKCDVAGPTKENIRAIVIYKSEVCTTDKVVEIGCGTGGFTCEFSQRAKDVVTSDLNKNACELTRDNLNNFNLGENVNILNCDGKKIISTIENMDILLVGGNGNELRAILEDGNPKLNSGGRIIVVANFQDSQVQAVKILKELGYNPKVVVVNIANGRVLDRGIKLESDNPVAIISAKKR